MASARTSNRPAVFRGSFVPFGSLSPDCLAGIFMLLAALTGPLPAALLFHETFSYPDGPLAQAAPETWFNYSGASNQLQVIQGRARLSENLAEDLHVFLPGRPHTGGVLYVRFVLQYSRLPSGGGGCFLLFKDAGVNNNRACLYATTMDAPAGHFRLGVRLTGVTAPLYAQYHPLSCPTQTEQVVVMRYQVNPPAAALWINPSSEQDSALEIPPDGTAPLAIHALGLRQSLASGNGMGELSLDSLRVGYTFADVAPPGAPPTLSAVPDLAMAAGGFSKPVSLTLADEDTPLPFIFLYGACDPPELIPPDGFIFEGVGGERTMVLRAAEGRQGTAQVTLVALDDTGLSAQRAFLVRVGAPICEDIPDQIIRVNETLEHLPVRLQDPEGDPLAVTLLSSDRVLFPATNLVISGEGYERRLSVRPAADRTGHAVISLHISDGHHLITNRFDITVAPRWGRLLQEEFDYPDGPLVPGGAARWQTHSGQAGQAMVENGALRLSMNHSEDVHAVLTPSPITSATGCVLYARMDFQVLDLPTNTPPAYWAHFKDGGNGFRCRIFVVTNQAPAGHYRLGLASAAALPTAETPQLLALETRYTVVARYNVSQGRCVMWINPSHESDPAIVAGDTAGSSTVVAWAFRQAANIGVVQVDRLWIGTAFEDVAAPRPRLLMQPLPGRLVLRWPEDEGWHLETAHRLFPEAWQTLPTAFKDGQGWLVWTNRAQETMQFFRLRR